MMGATIDRDFTRNLVISFGAHILIAIMAFLGGKLVLKIFKNNDVEIIRSSVRVDVVGMPKFTVQELKAMQREANLKPDPEVAAGTKEETKVEAPDVIKKDDLVIPEEDKKKKTSFLNMLSDYSNKKVATKDKKIGAETGEGKKSIDTLILEGNRLSKGSAIVGEYSDQENSDFAAYVQTIPDVVRQFWKLPSYLLDKELRCRIRIYLSADGNVLKLDLHESSGEKEFDARAEKAIRDASPFPKPAEAVAQRLTNSGIILGFPL